MIDLRKQLPTKKPIPYRTSDRFTMVHYNGPSVAGKTDLQVISQAANYHVNTRGWPTIAYHFAVGRDGTHFKLNDRMVRGNHAGVGLFNNEATAIFVVNGEGDIPPLVQLQGLEALIEDLGHKPRYILSHREAPRTTACPGAQLTRWLARWREGKSGAPFLGKVKYVSNVRDEPNVLSHLVRKLSPGTVIRGVEVLGSPVQGDSLWVRLEGTTDYVHASGIGI